MQNSERPDSDMPADGPHVTKTDTADAESNTSFEAVSIETTESVSNLEPNISRLGLPQDFQNLVGVKEVVSTVKRGRPHRQAFFRVRSGAGWRMTMAIFKAQDDGELYAVDRSLLDTLAHEFVVSLVYLCITRQKALSLWPVALPGSDGRINPWHASAHDAAARAEDRWIRLVADQHLGAYRIVEATGDLGKPAWPDLTFAELVQVGFRGRVIDSADHPILRRLRGEA